MFNQAFNSWVKELSTYKRIKVIRQKINCLIQTTKFMDLGILCLGKTLGHFVLRKNTERMGLRNQLLIKGMKLV